MFDEVTMKTVCKKILPEYFDAVEDGRKNFEIRKDEDGFVVGDYVRLKEWDDNNGYTGRSLERRITYILRDAEQYGLMPGYCILGFGKNRIWR